MEFLGLLFIVAVIIIICVIVKIVSNKQKINRSSCPKCNAIYDYDEDIEWHVTGTTLSGDNKSATQKANVEFKCHCPICGYVKTLNIGLTIGSINSTGNVSTYNLEDKAAKVFLSSEQREKLLRKRSGK